MRLDARRLATDDLRLELPAAGERTHVIALGRSGGVTGCYEQDAARIRLDAIRGDVLAVAAFEWWLPRGVVRAASGQLEGVLIDAEIPRGRALGRSGFVGVVELRTAQVDGLWLELAGVRASADLRLEVARYRQRDDGSVRLTAARAELRNLRAHLRDRPIVVDAVMLDGVDVDAPAGAGALRIAADKAEARGVHLELGRVSLAVTEVRLDDGVSLVGSKLAAPSLAVDELALRAPELARVPAAGEGAAAAAAPLPAAPPGPVAGQAAAGELAAAEPTAAEPTAATATATAAELAAARASAPEAAAFEVAEPAAPHGGGVDDERSANETKSSQSSRSEQSASRRRRLSAWSEPGGQRGREPVDLRLLDRLNGQIDVDLTADTTVPLIGRRKATHHFRIPIADGRINYRELERDLASLEDAFIDIEVRDGKLSLEKDIPLLPFYHKTMMYWHLSEDDLTLAKQRLVRLRSLFLWAVPDRRKLEPEDDKDASVAVRTLEFENIDIDLSLLAPAEMRLGAGVIRLGAAGRAGIGQLSIDGDVRYHAEGTVSTSEVRVAARELFAAIEGVALGTRRLSIGGLGVEAIVESTLAMAGVVPQSMAATLRGLRAHAVAVDLAASADD